MELSTDQIQFHLNRRRPAQSKLSTSRNESDTVEILSGVEHGITLGTPVSLFVRNKDARPADYSGPDIPRPSHGDFTYQCKYGVRSSSGGGRASARETLARVAAGAVALTWLEKCYNLRIVAWVSRVGNVEYLGKDPVSRDDVDINSVRCPDPETAARMTKRIVEVKEAGDSIGGVITCVCYGVPSGLGEPCFDKLEAVLAHAMLSIPAARGFEIGSGFEAASLTGSQHNDLFNRKGSNSIGTKTNRSGGVQAGISNGQPILFRVPFKPPATIALPQATVDFQGTSVTLENRGRHDPCVVPRAVPIVEAMAALVIADALLIQEGRRTASSSFPVLGRAGDPMN